MVIGLAHRASSNESADSEVEEQVLYYAGRLLKNTFCGSDAIFRNGVREFWVIMPDTAELDANTAATCRKVNAERGNIESGTGFEFRFSSGIAPHIPGAHCADIVERARRSMFLNSQQVNLTF